MEWYLDEDTVISDGPVKPICVGYDIDWYMHAKQGVFLLSTQESVTQCNNSIDLEAIFDPIEGDMKFAVK